MATQKMQQALQGNERIQQLAEEFPQVPLKKVLRMDIDREGIRPTAGSRLAGRWAWPYAPWFFDYSHEDAQEKEAMTSQGYFLTPVAGYLSDGLYFTPLWDSKSPYEIRYEERGRYRLYRDGDPIDDVFFPPRPAWYDRQTSSGKPMPTIMQTQNPGQLYLVPLNSCGYGKDTCLYCNINASDATKKGWGLERTRTKSEQDIYETLLAALPEMEHIYRIIVSGGVMLDSHKEAQLYARTIKAVKRPMKDAGVDIPITVLCQAMEAEDQALIKESGATKLAHNLEVWDPRMFKVICPGKAKLGREKWLEALLRARELMGLGGAYSLFVNGIGLLHPDGYKTEDEDFEQYVEGLEWMLSHGLETFGVHFRPESGTIFGGKAPPRTEYFLRCELALYELERKYPDVRSKIPRPAGDIRGDLHRRDPQGESRPSGNANC